MTWAKRALRARALAPRCPASREALDFYAALAAWLDTIHPARPEDVLPGLRDLVLRLGPEPLRKRAREAADLEPWGPLHFFGRVCRQAVAVLNPGCEGPPQAGCLVPQADGLALELVCAVCLARRPHPRGCCPGCAAERLAHYSAPDFPHLQLQACDACQQYLVLVDLSRDPEAIPEVDELAALPLDLWARDQGYRKLFPNLAGI